jgi:hypothetical protein
MNEMKFKAPAKYYPAAFVVIFSAFLMGEAVAQQTVTSASLSGRVEDARGAAVSDASLTATNIETNQKQIATTYQDGHYRFPYLQVGRYQLSIAAQ